MNMSGCRFGPHVTDRYRFRSPTLRNVTSTLPTVTDRYRSLPNFTVTCVTRVTSVTDPNNGPFEQIFKDL
jgi:hypothetical protein